MIKSLVASKDYEKELKKAAKITERFYPNSSCVVTPDIKDSILCNCTIKVDQSINIDIVYAFLKGYYLGSVEEKLMVNNS